MLSCGGLQRAQIGEPHGDDVSDRGGDAGGVDGAQVGEGPQHVGASDLEATLRRQTLAVDGPVHDHAVEPRLRAVAGVDHVDGIVVGPRDAPQPGRRPMRGERLGAGGCDTGDDALLGRVGRAREAGDVRVHGDQRAGADGAVPGRS
jgi:hypothetical protein